MTESATVFNNPVEVGVRALAALVAAYPERLDLQRIVYFDYLLVHSGDAGGPTSLHPDTPYRTGEIAVRRSLLEGALSFMAARGLVGCHYDDVGISWVASDDAGVLLHSMETPYSMCIIDLATWAQSTFGSMSTNEIGEFFSERLVTWGGEFALTYSPFDEEFE